MRTDMKHGKGKNFRPKRDGRRAICCGAIFSVSHWDSSCRVMDTWSTWGSRFPEGHTFMSSLSLINASRFRPFVLMCHAFRSLFVRRGREKTSGLEWKSERMKDDDRWGIGTQTQTHTASVYSCLSMCVTGWVSKAKGQTKNVTHSLSSSFFLSSWSSFFSSTGYCILSLHEKNCSFWSPVNLSRNYYHSYDGKRSTESMDRLLHRWSVSKCGKERRKRLVQWMDFLSQAEVRGKGMPAEKRERIKYTVCKTQ